MVCLLVSGPWSPAQGTAEPGVVPEHSEGEEGERPAGAGALCPESLHVSLPHVAG